MRRLVLVIGLLASNFIAPVRADEPHVEFVRGLRHAAWPISPWTTCSDSAITRRID